MFWRTSCPCDPPRNEGVQVTDGRPGVILDIDDVKSCTSSGSPVHISIVTSVG